MKRLGLLLFLLAIVLCGCGKISVKETAVRAPEGTIGDEMPISRAQAAKMIALAFYTPEELEEIADQTAFPDVKKEHWAYTYINAAAELAFFSGDEAGFRPEDDLLLWEAQILMDRLAPDYESRMVITDENREMPVAYSLWTKLFEKALMARRGEDSLYSYGIQKETRVLFTAGAENGFDQGLLTAAGYDLTPYTDEKISFWRKEDEIIGLLTVEEATPTVYSIYCRREGDRIVLVGGVEKAYAFGGEEFQEGICHVTITDGRVSLQEGARLAGETIKRVDEKEISLSAAGILPWAAEHRIYGLDFTPEKEKDLICGTDMADFYVLDEQVIGAVIRKEVKPEKIRVLLGGGLQDSVQVRGAEGFSLANAAGEKDFSSGEATLTGDLAWFDHGIVTVTGKVALTFANGEERAYSGLLELERIGGRIAIINELSLEEYLLGVVPYEMPVSFGQAALEAQAICARSYAYNQFYANAYGKYGAHVTDTVASQVFMGADTALEAQNAVAATEGMCVVAGDRVALTYFYSASGGYGTQDVDVWSKDGSFSGRGRAYLQGQAHGVTQPMPATEEEWLAFWQDWSIEGYDQASDWYRWKVYFSAGQLSEIAAQTLAAVSAGNEMLVRTAQADGSWRAGIPKELGRLTGISVQERGQGGVIKVLQMDFEKAAVQVLTENAIRRVLSPVRRTLGEEIYLQRMNGQSVTGRELLPSGFFAVREMTNEEGRLTGVAIYGGGNGHGVGMSQYGARELAAQGMSSAEIIQYYFPGTTVEKVM